MGVGGGDVVFFLYALRITKKCHSCQYAVAVAAVEAGAIPSGDLTDVMTEVKLMWLLAQGTNSIDAVRNGILSEYSGEITGEKFRSLVSL